ncbi:MAG: STAS domain-containing protein [Armatimonadota bacterium]
MKPQSFDISMTQRERSQVISLSGEIDFAASLYLDPMLSRVVRDCDGELLFDLSKVTFIDSEGIKTLLSAFHKMGQKRRKARIVRCSGRALRVMRLAGVDGVLGILNVNPEPTDAPLASRILPDLDARQRRVQPLRWITKQE